MPTRQEVTQFLNEFKAAMSLRPVVRKLRSNTAKAHLSGLEVNWNQAEAYLESLTPDNYFKGPEPDDSDPQHDVWMFGCDVAGIEAYIKLTTRPGNRRGTIVYAVIWSYHKAEHPMRYPLRESP